VVDDPRGADEEVQDKDPVVNELSPSRAVQGFGCNGRCGLVLAFSLLISRPVLAQLTLHECRLSGEPVRCGTLRVPENRQASNGRQLALSIIIAPRQGVGDAKEPLFVLKGGPGEQATSNAGDALEMFRAQRGTGGENRLDCEVSDRAFVVPRDPEGCLRELTAKADLRQYTTDHFVEDLDAARAALGYEQISLWAGSYGTRAAYVYAKRHPQRVRSLVLIAPAPISMPVVDSFEEDSRAALEALMTDCLSDDGCGRAFPTLRTDTQKVLDGLTDPFERFGLLALQYSSTTLRLIPLLMRQAAAGDREPLTSAIRDVHRLLMPRLALGLHLAVLCSEDLPFRSQGAKPSFARLEYERACRGWPRATLAEDFRVQVRVDAAALLITGEWDPATSPRWAHVARDQFSRNQVVIVPKEGHILARLDECVAAMTREFLDTAHANPSCAMQARRPSYAVRP
jgi:pimeloyl-ACP methyl ester carboxylesterase